MLSKARPLQPRSPKIEQPAKELFPLSSDNSTAEDVMCLFIFAVTAKTPEDGKVDGPINGRRKKLVKPNNVFCKLAGCLC